MSGNYWWKAVLGGDAVLNDLGITGVSNMVVTNPTELSSDDDNKKKLGIGLGVGLGVGIPVVVAVVAFFVMRRKDPRMLRLVLHQHELTIVCYYIINGLVPWGMWE